MILVCGPLSDGVLSHFTAYLVAQGIEFVFLDQRQYGREIRAAWSIKQRKLHGTLIFDSWNLPLDAISGVFVRWELEEEDSDPRLGATKKERLNAQGLLYEEIRLFLQALPCIVANRPTAIVSNISKPYQLGLLQKIGFDIPNTLITNDPVIATRFYRAHKKKVIVKSLSNIRSIVRQLSADDLERFESLSLCPVQLQELVDGDNIRVHVIGNKIFATEIMSNAIDYRYAETPNLYCEMRPVQLPKTVAERCLVVSRMLRLHLAGIDLCRCAKGRWVCFEVNPNPAFTWFEEEAKQPMCPVLANQLLTTKASQFL